MTTTVKKYRALDNSGNDYAGMHGMSATDRAAINAAQQSWRAAQAAGDQTGMDAAHQQAESIRSRYQYSGGEDGSQYLPKPGTAAAAVPTYTNRYDERKQQLLDSVLNQKQFSYDIDKDPLYQAYVNKYQREGSKAMENTLAQVSSRTGGLASSYAGQAAQQTYDGHMQELSDKVPELYQMAYNQYLQDYQQQADKLGLVRTAEQDDYAKYLDALGQYNTDRNFNYGAYRDQIGDARYDSETEYERAAARAKLLAAAGDYSGYKALGYSDEDIATMQAGNQPKVVYRKVDSGDGGGGEDGYGANYSGIYRNARRMYDQGKSKEEIISYLDSINTGITDAGMNNILYNLGMKKRP